MSLPEGWEIVALKSMATVQSGIGFPKKYQGLTDETFPFYKVGDIAISCKENKSILEYANNYISEKNRIELKGKLIKEGSTVFPKIGEAIKLNRRAYLVKTGLIDNNVMSVKSMLDDGDKYLYYFLKTIDMSLLSRSTTVPSIRKGDIENLQIPLPSLKEQKKIAQKLDQVLARVERIKMALDNTPATIKRFRQSVLALAVSGGLTESWRDENQENIEAYRFKEQDDFNDKRLMNLPSSWIWTEFRNVAKIKSNLVDPLLTPNDYHIAPNHIESGTGKLLEFQTVAEDNVKSGKHRFYSGQILYSKIRPYLNKVCLVDFDGLCSADMYPIEAIIDRKYLYYSILSNQFSYWTATLQGRVVLPKINQKALNTIPISVPSLEEQKAIVKKVETLFALADNLEAKLNQAQKRVDRLTQSILAKAFRGEL